MVSTNPKMAEDKEDNVKTSIGKRASVLVFLLFFGLAGSIPAYGQDGKYALYELGTLGGPNTYAYDINDASQIVGVGDTNLYREGWVWQAFSGTKEGISALFPGEEARSSANAINNDGTIVGNKGGKAFMLGGGSSFVELGVLPGAGASSGLSINSGKKVVGYSWNEGVWERGALWENASPGNDIGTLGGIYTRATSVNNLDQVAGYSQNEGGSNRAFRWKKVLGTEPLTDLGVLDGFTDSFGLRINNKGTVVGYSQKYDIYWNETNLACLWGENGIQELQKNVLRVSETVLQSQAFGINDAGVVVGTHLVGTEYRAFIWDSDNKMRDLNSLLPENSGFLLVVAYAINNKGEIVGYGYKTGSTDATAFVLVPPETKDPIVGPFQVDMDIRPWNSQNKVNLWARWGLIPVAILSDADFNALKEVDRQSLTFGRTGDEDSLAFCMPWKWDVNRDRKKDLICYFHEKATGFKCGDTVGTLKGKTKTLKAEPFEAQDQVEIIPCPPLRKHHRGK